MGIFVVCSCCSGQVSHIIQLVGTIRNGYQICYFQVVAYRMNSSLVIRENVHSNPLCCISVAWNKLALIQKLKVVQPIFILHMICHDFQLVFVVLPKDVSILSFPHRSQQRKMSGKYFFFEKDHQNILFALLFFLPINISTCAWYIFTERYICMVAQIGEH